MDPIVPVKSPDLTYKSYKESLTKKTTVRLFLDSMKKEEKSTLNLGQYHVLMHLSINMHYLIY